MLVAQRQPLLKYLSSDPGIAWLAADLSERKTPYPIVEAVRERFGDEAVLVNNAGFMFEKSVDDMTEEDWDQMTTVNMPPPVFLAKALLPQMRRRGGGIYHRTGEFKFLRRWMKW